MLTFTSSQLRDTVKKDDTSAEVTKAVDAIDFLEFSDLEDSLKEDVKFLQEHPLVLKETKVSGWIHHVETGKVRGR